MNPRVLGTDISEASINTLHYGCGDDDDHGDANNNNNSSIQPQLRCGLLCKWSWLSELLSSRLRISHKA
jgi:hypothetical protein